MKPITITLNRLTKQASVVFNTSNLEKANKYLERIKSDSKTKDLYELLKGICPKKDKLVVAVNYDQLHQPYEIEFKLNDKLEYSIHKVTYEYQYPYSIVHGFTILRTIRNKKVIKSLEDFEVSSLSKLKNGGLAFDRASDSDTYTFSDLKKSLKTLETLVA